MYPLDNRVQEYAWGSRTAIAELLGRPSPSPHPQAELWLGAHPSAPSRVERDGRWESLLEVIASAPEDQLGAAVVSKFGPTLPFLFKVLAAETPLSLQVHPNAEQARAGFEVEERAHIPLDASRRQYKDPRHKPELLCSLGPFELLCGFRQVSETARFLKALRIEPLSASVAALEREPTSARLKTLSFWLLSLDQPTRLNLVAATIEACRQYAESGGEFARECSWAVRIASMYPGDIGVVMGLLLNLVTLETGRAIYLPAGNLHSYLKGVGLEIMANSDNVIRGGLTPKHVDAAELLRVLTFTDAPVPVISPEGEGLERIYGTPASEFCLSRITLGGSDGFRADQRQGPEILLCTEGTFTITSSDGTSRSVPKGTSWFVPAKSGAYFVSGAGTLFRARVGAL
jgi:mannose-6-phosphate isomerase